MSDIMSLLFKTLEKNREITISDKLDEIDHIVNHGYPNSIT